MMTGALVVLRLTPEEEFLHITDRRTLALMEGLKPHELANFEWARAHFKPFPRAELFANVLKHAKVLWNTANRMR